MKERGKFVAVYGIDGTGKSTTVDMLGEEMLNFRQHPAYKRNIYSKIKKDVLTHSDPQEMFAFYMASNLWQGQEIEGLLENGIGVVKDRWILDIVGHHLHAGFKQSADAADKFDYLKPDLSVLLTTEEETRLQRMKDRGDLDGKDTDLERARFLADFLYSRVKLMGEKGLIIDNTDLTPEEVVGQIELEIWHQKHEDE